MPSVAYGMNLEVRFLHILGDWCNGSASDSGSPSLRSNSRSPIWSKTPARPGAIGAGRKGLGNFDNAGADGAAIGTGDVPGNEGVASTVQKTANSIGYVELAYAIQHQLSFAAIRNSAGEFVRPDLRSLGEAARELPRTATGELGSIVNPPGKDAYPIATFTWLIVPYKMTDAAKKSAAKEFFQWMLTSGQRECSSLGYAPLPNDVAAQQLELLKRFD